MLQVIYSKIRNNTLKWSLIIKGVRLFFTVYQTKKKWKRILSTNVNAILLLGLFPVFLPMVEPTFCNRWGN